MLACGSSVMGEGAGGFGRLLTPLLDAVTAQLVHDQPAYPQTICPPCCWCIGTSAAVPP
jgi:hypothetical protein